mmetsp:Transcript_76329/g.210696  ORF Transcript_76329/g.210696 Transcript_76329/m.210696 type:complete len:218 (-) Transcript_76329:7-660(-)
MFRCCILFRMLGSASAWPSNLWKEDGPSRSSSTSIGRSFFRACGSLKAYSLRCSMRRLASEKSLAAFWRSRVATCLMPSRCCSTWSWRSPASACRISSSTSASCTWRFSSSWASNTAWSTPNCRLRGSNSFVRRCISSWRFFMIFSVSSRSWLRCARSAWAECAVSKPGLAVPASDTRPCVASLGARPEALRLLSMAGLQQAGGVQWAVHYSSKAQA